MPILLQAAIWISIWSIFAFTGNTSDRLPGYYLVITVRVLAFVLFYNLAYATLMPLYFSDKKRAFNLLLPLLFAAYVGTSVVTDLTLGKPEKMYATIEKKDNYPKKRPLSWLLLPPIFLGMTIFGVAAAFRGISEFENKKKAEEEANHKRLEAEIALLKSQINPHFLLNTLNNLYGISIAEPDKTPDALLKLSDMVRYILYECAQATVPLHHDLSFVKNYISLQELRLPPNATLRLEMPDHEPTWPIEPMVIIPFVENAFKHGLTTRQPCEMIISIKAEDKVLELLVENQIFIQKQTNQGNQSGIGMANVMQRLEHTYAGRYQLDISEDQGKHRVLLKLQL